jgi:16S rRNA (guanine527-N7)-methyltransferase
MMDRHIPDWLNVSRETIEKLDHFVAEVLRWNPAINLVSKSSIADIWQRHILDSAQLFPLAESPGIWADFGAGGGFPGIVLAILGAPQMVLVESDQRKATFLRQMARQLSLPVTVIAKRIDTVEPLAAQTVSARALASLTELLCHATPHLAPDGRAIFPKGRGFEQELQLAQIDWVFDATRIPSRTDPEAAILMIENIRRR